MKHNNSVESSFSILVSVPLRCYAFLPARCYIKLRMLYMGSLLDLFSKIDLRKSNKRGVLSAIGPYKYLYQLKACFMAPNKITPPREYFDEKFLLTAGGTITAVWLFCGVAASLIPIEISYYWWRLIAFILSLIFTFAFAVKQGSNKIRNLLIVLLNGFVIYAGACGLNSINKGVNLWNKQTKSDSITTHKDVDEKKNRLASLIPFREVNWWPDKDLENKNEELLNEIQTLKATLSTVNVSLIYDKLETPTRSWIITKDSILHGGDTVKNMQIQKTITIASGYLFNIIDTIKLSREQSIQIENIISSYKRKK